MFFSWADVGVGKFDGPTGITDAPVGVAVVVWGVVAWLVTVVVLFGSASGAYVDVIVNSITLDDESWWAGDVAAPVALFATLFLVSMPEKSPLENSRDLAKEVIACSFVVFPLISTLAPLTFTSVT